MSFEQAANMIATRVRDTGLGYLTIRRDELRDAFGITRFAKNQTEEVVDALERVGLLVHPHPAEAGGLLRLYDRNDCLRPVARIADCVLRPEAVPEGELRRASELFARAVAGSELRSEHVPWLVAFDVFLQVVLGREPEAWEELRDDRHRAELAADLCAALGLPDEVARRGTTLQVAAAVCALRPRARAYHAEDFAVSDAELEAAAELAKVVADVRSVQRERHAVALRAAARLISGAPEPPERVVEMGLLGLRYRREDARGE